MLKEINIFREILRLLKAGETPVLATVAGTSGSTPAGPSAKMLVRAGKTETIGTVGGGCLEAGAIQDARIAMHQNAQRLAEYELNDEDTEGGLICGGQAKILLEPLESSSIPVFERICELQNDGCDSVLVSAVRPGEKTAKSVFRDNIVEGAHLPEDIAAFLKTSAEEIIRSEKPETVDSASGIRYLCEPVTGYPTLFIFGGGHVSFYIAHFAKITGFRIVIIDDREKFANRERFPDADDIIVSDYTSVFGKLRVLASSFIIIVTRGHSFDECVLEQAVKTPAHYIGMIGSRRKVLLTMQHLRERGIAQETLDAVFSPLGLDLRAKTPAEIGISTVAELIKVRRKGAEANVGHMADSVRGIQENDQPSSHEK